MSAKCDACGYTESHDPNCPMPTPECDNADKQVAGLDDKGRALYWRTMAKSLERRMQRDEALSARSAIDAQTDAVLEMAEKWKGRADDCGQLARMILVSAVTETLPTAEAVERFPGNVTIPRALLAEAYRGLKRHYEMPEVRREIDRLLSAPAEAEPTADARDAARYRFLRDANDATCPVTLLTDTAHFSVSNWPIAKQIDDAIDAAMSQADGPSKP